MDSLRKKVAPELKMFFTRQYFVLFFMVAAGLKLCLFINMIGYNYTLTTMSSGFLLSFFTAIVFFTPLFFIKRGKKTAAFAMAFLLSLMLIGDLAYYRFFHALPTIGLIDAISQAKDVAGQGATLLVWSDIILVADLLLFVFFELLALRLSGLSWVKEHKEIKVGFIEKVLLASVFTSVILLASAFAFVPRQKQKLSDAVKWSFEARYNTQMFGVVGSHMIDGYRYIEESLITISPSEKIKVLDWVKKSVPAEKSKSPLFGSVNGKRIIVIQVESLSNFVIGQKVEGQEITPSLNKFKNEAHYFSDTRFIFGAGHTSDTDLVANTSLYPLYDSAAFVRYGKDDYTGLAKILKSAGYQADAYHAHNRNFWNRSVALRSLGFDRFYAYESFPNGLQINMNGINDYVFLENTGKLLKSNPEKSLTYAITLSSHFPFKIYPETQGLKINPDSYPTFVAGYLENINYTDRAIGNLIDNLRKDGLYEDSLIVIYGDHNTPLDNFKTPEVSFDSDGLDSKQVPLLIKLPNQRVGEVHAQTVTTQDITPTILDLVGIKARALMFGQSLFAPTERCVDGFVKRPNVAGTCDAQVKIEKEMAAKVIKYNLFSELYR